MSTSNIELIQWAKELNLDIKIYMKDELKLNTPNKIEYGIVNTDLSTGEGIHWVSYFINDDKNKCYYFDSFGAHIMNELRDYLKKDKNRLIDCHNWQIQNFTESSCGFYCLLFLLLCKKGYKYEDIILNLIK